MVQHVPVYYAYVYVYVHVYLYVQYIYIAYFTGIVCRQHINGSQ